MIECIQSSSLRVFILVWSLSRLRVRWLEATGAWSRFSATARNTRYFQNSFHFWFPRAHRVEFRMSKCPRIGWMLRGSSQCNSYSIHLRKTCRSICEFRLGTFSSLRPKHCCTRICLNYHPYQVPLKISWMAARWRRRNYWETRLIQSRAVNRVSLASHKLLKGSEVVE